MYYALHRPGLGVWDPKEYGKDDLLAIIPVARVQFSFAAALFGSTLMALMGKTDTKSLLIGASAGVLATMALTAATGRD